MGTGANFGEIITVHLGWKFERILDNSGENSWENDV
jgi:hypothetical protein